MSNGCKNRSIQSIVIIIALLFSFGTASSQYYYKDLVTTRQINDNFRTYKASRVTNVKLNSFQGNVPVTEGFTCEQRVSLSRNEVFTYTQTADRGESFLTAFYTNDGLLSKTIDSSESTISTSTYQYDAAKRLIQLVHETHALDKSSATTERHTWQYSDAGNPVAMVRLKNGTDSTHIRFVTDNKGNIVEEEADSKGQALPKVFYYYDEKNRLTDVVRYNAAANRLLPDYIFEYEETGELSAMTIVPEGSTDYQKWYYSYDDKGLKLVEFCYNKRNELLGKVEYAYTLAK